jgi:hypothetical protein
VNSDRSQRRADSSVALMAIARPDHSGEHAGIGILRQAAPVVRSVSSGDRFQFQSNPRVERAFFSNVGHFLRDASAGPRDGYLKVTGQITTFGNFEDPLRPVPENANYPVRHCTLGIGMFNGGIVPTSAGCLVGRDDATHFISADTICITVADVVQGWSPCLERQYVRSNQAFRNVSKT